MASTAFGKYRPKNDGLASLGIQDHSAPESGLQPSRLIH